jgi:hypothetical protein
VHPNSDGQQGFQAIDNPIARIRKPKISRPLWRPPIWLDAVPSVNKVELAPIVLPDFQQIDPTALLAKGTIDDD